MPTVIRIALLLTIAAFGARGVLNNKISSATDPWPSDIGTSRFGTLISEDDTPSFAGAWIRPHPGPFIWNSIETRKGSYDWRKTDALVKKWEKKRLAVLATLWPYASWDQTDCHTDKPKGSGVIFPFGTKLLYSPCNWVSYLSWIRAVVERYDGDGTEDMPGLVYGIRHWEILNEPEMQSSDLAFFLEDATSYNTLYNRSYQAVKEADANAVVLPGGQSGMQQEAKTYWTKALDNDNTLVDVGNIHSLRASNNFYASEYRFFLNSLNYTKTPFWITEGQAGSLTSPPKTSGEAAELLFTSFVKAFANGAEKVFWVGSNDPTASISALETATFNTLVSSIGSFASVAQLGSSSVVFTKSDSTRVYALWNNAALPSSIETISKAVTYANKELPVDPRAFRANTPTLIFVKP